MVFVKVLLFSYKLNFVPRWKFLYKNWKYDYSSYFNHSWSHNYNYALKIQKFVRKSLRPIGWVSHVNIKANLWSNFQDCKISSRAEIPKLYRVLQNIVDPACFKSSLVIVSASMANLSSPNYLVWIDFCHLMLACRLCFPSIFEMWSLYLK